MRYTGPLGKSFAGDRQRAMSLQSRARVLVGRLLYALKRQGGKGQQYGTERQDDGSVIHAYVLANIKGQQPLIRTWIESPVRVAASEIIAPQWSIGPLWSGIVYPVYDTNYPISQAPVYYTGKKVGATSWRHNAFCIEDFSIEEAFGKFLPLRNTVSPTDKGIPYTYKQPSVYSGTMRTVVQHMLGAGYIPPWNYKWNDSAWIYTAANGSEFVIDFSDDNGLRFAALTYHPDLRTGCPNRKQIAIGNGAWTTLIAREYCSDYFNTRSIYADSGFAANTRGTEARNLSQNITSEASPYTYVYEWLIAISESDGLPASATLTRVSESLAWSKVPEGTRVPNGPYYSTVWDVTWPYRPEQPAEYPTEWPIHVFYDGDTLRRYTRTDSPPLDDLILEEENQVDTAWWQPDGVFGHCPPSGEGVFKSGKRIMYQPTRRFSGFGAPTSKQSIVTLGGSVDTFTMTPFMSGMFSVAYGSELAGIGYGNLFSLNKHTFQVTSNSSKSYHQAAWIPGNDREGILFLDYEVIHGWSWMTKTHGRGHHFLGSIDINLGAASNNTMACCGSDGAMVVKTLDTVPYAVNEVKFDCRMARIWSGGWRQPGGECPSGNAQPYMEYLCPNDVSGTVPNTNYFDDSSEIESDPSSNAYTITVVASGGFTDIVEAGENLTLAPGGWLDSLETQQSFPLRWLRDAYGRGVIQSGFSALPEKLVSLPGTNPVYTKAVEDHGTYALWVGVPH